MLLPFSTVRNNSPTHYNNMGDYDASRTPISKSGRAAGNLLSTCFSVGLHRMGKQKLFALRLLVWF